MLFTFIDLRSTFPQNYDKTTQFKKSSTDINLSRHPTVLEQI